MKDRGQEEMLRRELTEICRKIKTVGPRTRYRASVLHKITEFGGASRKHQLLMDFLLGEGIDVKEAKSVLGFAERKDVYRALAELIPCDEFADIFMRIKRLSSYSRMPKRSRIRTLKQKISVDRLAAFRERSKALQDSMSDEFLRTFRKEVQTEFKRALKGEPDVYCYETYFEGRNYMVITFDFPREQRLSVWKHRKEVIHVPEYIAIWIDLEDGSVSCSESSLHHRLFPHLEEILKRGLKLPALDVVRHNKESTEVASALAEGVSGKVPVRQMELAGRDDRKIERIVISGESVLEKLREIIGDQALDMLLKSLDLRFVKGEKDYVIE